MRHRQFLWNRSVEGAGAAVRRTRRPAFSSVPRPTAGALLAGTQAAILSWDPSPGDHGRPERRRRRCDQAGWQPPRHPNPASSPHRPPCRSGVPQIQIEIRHNRSDCHAANWFPGTQPLRKGGFQPRAIEENPGRRDPPMAERRDRRRPWRHYSSILHLHS